jgi:hypothetical protein
MLLRIFMQAPTTMPRTSASIADCRQNVSCLVQAYGISMTRTSMPDGSVVFKFMDPSSLGSLDLGSNVLMADVLVVGGGGGGSVRHAGGGGAGAFIYLQGQMLNGSYAIKVGAGGRGASCPQTNTAVPSCSGGFGEDSFIQLSGEDVYRAKGGGAGGAWGAVCPTGGSVGQGCTGGSSGGNVAGWGYTSSLGAVPLERSNLPMGTFGNYGGKGTTDSCWAGGGGGGSNSNGIQGTCSPYVAGNGGSGSVCNITGTPAVYAAGGGGGVENTGTRGTGGGGLVGSVFVKVGGDGSSGTAAAGAGIAATGSGGGGSGFQTGTVHNGNAGAGGSGVVIVRVYPCLAGQYYVEATSSCLQTQVTDFGGLYV